MHIHYFQRYHSKENVDTANAMLLPVYEWNNIKTKGFPLFSPKCFFTDDTVMTLAIAEGLMNGGSADDFILAMKKYGRLYPDAGYGGRFGSWLFSNDIDPYNSWGNGSAMRACTRHFIDSTCFTPETSVRCCNQNNSSYNGVNFLRSDSFGFSKGCGNSSRDYWD